MITVKVTVTGRDNAINQLNRLKDIVKDMHSIYKDVGDWWIKFLQGEVFASEGGVYGKRWANLDERYAFYKATKWGSVGILIASGHLRQGWNQYVTSDYLIVKNEATNNRGDYYGAYHQNGTTRMPARPILLVDSGRAATIRDLIVSSLNRQIRGI